MPSQTTQATAQPRRVEPIFDASGALRRQSTYRTAQKDTARQTPAERD